MKPKIRFRRPPCATAELVGELASPAETLAILTRGYTGRYDSELRPEEVEQFLKELASTKLHTPLRFATMVWLFKGVTRAFTHQLVRYQIGTSFVQESLRFSVHDTVDVLLPTRYLGETGSVTFPGLTYKLGCESAVDSYHEQLRLGAAPEDARGVLPTNVLTSIFFGCNMETLAHIYTQRLCCQAQSQEWTPLMRQIKEILTRSTVWSPLAGFLKAPWEGGAISCGFGASFDRPCTNQKHFDENLLRIYGEAQQRIASGEI